MIRLLRPLLTIILAVGLFITTTYFVYMGKIDPNTYLNTWIQIVGMIVSFLFGERSALKRPGDSSE